MYQVKHQGADIKCEYKVGVGAGDNNLGGVLLDDGGDGLGEALLVVDDLQRRVKVRLLVEDVLLIIFMLDHLGHPVLLAAQLVVCLHLQKSNTK